MNLQKTNVNTRQICKLLVCRQSAILKLTILMIKINFKIAGVLEILMSKKVPARYQ